VHDDDADGATATVTLLPLVTAAARAGLLQKVIAPPAPMTVSATVPPVGKVAPEFNVMVPSAVRQAKAALALRRTAAAPAPVVMMTLRLNLKLSPIVL
jgi:hypothetical protein